MKALVKVNGKSVGFFYNILKEETQAEMYARILKIIEYRYGNAQISIKWQQF